MSQSDGLVLPCHRVSIKESAESQCHSPVGSALHVYKQSRGYSIESQRHSPTGSDYLSSCRVEGIL